MNVVASEPKNQRGTHTIRGSHRRMLPALAASVLALSSCSYPRPLKGGHGLTTHDSRGAVRQSISQGDNPAQQSRQDQELVRLRTYTLPAGSRIQQPAAPGAQSSQTSNAVLFTLSAPMPVVEREEVRANTQLGASQKDTARELSARLASLRSISWVGVGLFVFGLASLVWPPLKAVMGSLTTSVALLRLDGLPWPDALLDDAVRHAVMPRPLQSDINQAKRELESAGYIQGNRDDLDDSITWTLTEKGRHKARQLA